LDGVEVPDTSIETITLEEVDEAPTLLCHSKRTKEQGNAQENTVNYALMSQVALVQEPSTFIEVSKDERWVKTMQMEYNSIMKNHTRDLVNRPTKCKVIGTKWVYKSKN